MSTEKYVLNYLIDERPGGQIIAHLLKDDKKIISYWIDEDSDLVLLLKYIGSLKAEQEK